jgi:hypothetical protein
MNTITDQKAVTATSRSSRSRFAVVVAGLLMIALAWAMLVAAQPAGAKSTKTIKRAALSGAAAFSAVNGEAKWTSKGGERELEVELEDAKALRGKRLTVRIGGATVGHMRVSPLGRARLVRATEAGQSVQASVAGKSVRITTAGGALVASGRF